MNFGYFCNTTNWNKKSYSQLLGEAREIAIYCDQQNWDSIWFTERDVIASINFINQNNKSKYFIKDRLFTVDEFNYTNFFIIDDMLKSGNIPPKSYLYDRIKSTIINQRKLDILKSINKEILNDALKSRKYEVYK